MSTLIYDESGLVIGSTGEVREGVSDAPLPESTAAAAAPTNEERDAYIATLGITYLAEFVPMSASRNADADYESLNWRVCLQRGAWTIATDYMQGIAHMPGYSQRNTTDQQRAREYASEKGLMQHGASSFRVKPLPSPLLRDVLWSLVLDASVLDSPSFEDWAAEYGYDIDSRAAERSYNVACENSRRLSGMVGAAALDKLRELFQDY